jgi:hypothetical protein
MPLLASLNTYKGDITMEYTNYVEIIADNIGGMPVDIDTTGSFTLGGITLVIPREAADDCWSPKQLESWVDSVVTINQIRLDNISDRNKEED